MKFVEERAVFARQENTMSYSEVIIGYKKHKSVGGLHSVMRLLSSWCCCRGDLVLLRAKN